MASTMSTETPKFFDAFPSTSFEWHVAAMRAGVANMSLQGFDDFQSASKLTQKQFLLLRVLVTNYHPHLFVAEVHNLTSQLNETRALIQDCEDFTTYLDAIREKSYHRRGIYYLLWKQQREVYPGAWHLPVIIDDRASQST